MHGIVRRSTALRPHAPATAGIRGALALIAALALTGCGGESDVIARVGDRPITVRDFEAAARTMSLSYPGEADSAKARLIDDLVRQQLFIEYGFRSGILVDSMARIDRRTMEDQMLRAVVIGALIPQSVPVSEAEVHRFWSWRDSASRCQIIYTPTRQLMDAAAAQLARGDDFGSVANAFNVTGMLPPEGDLGYVVTGSLSDPLDRMVRESKVGEIVGPVRAPGEGWFVFRVVDRQPSQRDSFRIEAPQLAQGLQQRKRRMLSARAFEALRDQYRVKMEPGAAQIFFTHVNTPGVFDGSYAAASAEDAKVLARFDGGGGHSGAYTLGDAMHDLETDEGERPNPTMLSSFAPWIESRVVERALLIEARRRRLHEDPELALQLKARFESGLLNSVFERAVTRTLVPTEEDARVAYERDRLPEAPPFEELDEGAKQPFMFAAMEVAQVRRFNALSDSLRAAIPVRLDEARIKRLPWPAPGPTEGPAAGGS